MAKAKAKKQAGLKVKVTQQHIRDGEYGMPESCAIALAVKDALHLTYKRCEDPLRLVNLDDLVITVNSDQVTVGSVHMDCTNEMTDFVTAFDALENNEKPEAPVKPIKSEYSSSTDYDYALECYKNDLEQHKDELKEWKQRQSDVKPFEFVFAV